MSTGWVAAGVRARAMSRRRLGRAAARTLARRGSLELALDELVSTPYQHDVHAGMDLAAAQHGVAATVLWHMRVLAGWVPRGNAQILRLLAGGFEAANVDERLKAIMGAPAGPDFRLGSLATAWHALASATTVPDVRRGLGRSAWGDPGADTAAAVRLSMRLTWALRVQLGVPDAGAWAGGAAALMVARESVIAGRPLSPSLVRVATPLLGTRWSGRSGLREFADAVPAQASWVLAGIEDAADLWRAEAHWWTRVEHEGYQLLHRPISGPAPVIGSVAILAADAWRVRGALEVAARGGSADAPALEAFDAVA